MDLFGPVKVYIQGRERKTRSCVAAFDSNCWIMVTVCPTTRLINMQVFERSLADGIIWRDQLERQRGVEFEVCPVAGHNQQGHVERVIHSEQKSFNDCGLLSKRYTATNLETLAKLI
jgi:GTP cyclohydrolase FolE2